MIAFTSFDLLVAAVAGVSTAVLLLGLRAYLSKDRADWFCNSRRHFQLLGPDGRTELSFLLRENETLDEGLSRALDESEQKSPTGRAASAGNVG